MKVLITGSQGYIARNFCKKLSKSRITCYGIGRGDWKKKADFKKWGYYQNVSGGVVGPINNNPRILTQSFVSRKHKELFGYYFPPEIINWFCDDWINEIYKKIGHFYPLTQHFCNNVGGQPRYEINNETAFRLLQEF